MLLECKRKDKTGVGPQGMWAFLPGPVWGRGGADAGDQVCKGGVAASGGESFPGSL